jgi:hypothetical protein
MSVASQVKRHPIPVGSDEEAAWAVGQMRNPHASALPPDERGRFRATFSGPPYIGAFSK